MNSVSTIIRNAGQGVLYLLSFFLLLYLGRSFLIPLSFSLLIGFISYPICRWLEQKKLSRAAAVSICILVLVLVGFGLLALLLIQFNGFLNEWPRMEERFLTLIADISVFISDTFSLGQAEQANWIKEALSSSFQRLLSIFPQMVYSSGVFLVMAILIPVMSALLLYHRTRLVHAMLYFFTPERRPEIRKLIELSVNTYYGFIKGMLIVYLIVGMLNSTGLFLLGIPHAFLFGFAASVMTFIPYIGILISSLLPISIAWVQFNSLWYPLGVIAIFTFVQYLEANLIFPMAVSKRLKVNTLATIAAILIGAIVWGGAGMILFIPFLGILKVVADHSKELKSLSLFLGADDDK
jgi:predicted PurR-regulated permease PerM